MGLKYANVSIGTYTVKSAITKEMVDDLSKHYGLDSSIEDILAEALKREKIYKRRKQIVDKLLKDM